MAACEGALLIVDATQGVEAQTLANVYLALEHDLEIIPIINKVDLPSADPDRVCKEIEDVIGLDASDAIMISAKTGLGVDQVLEAIVQRIPAPADEEDKPLRALIFDSHFDAYKGAIANIRIMEGSLKPGQRIRMMASGKEFEVIETGVFLPQRRLFGSQHEERPRLPRRRYGYLGRTAGVGSIAGLSTGRAHGLLRPLPGRNE